ncbi:hypothetical protein F9288_13075 [Sphingomonas sp. CL5.1]|uniref:GSU2403 family nucleotidyltransferase fold protein n=1 Tax=Sphingomonas sp. CL5.1 TaxID=2653203 RepID=UPI0015830B64|nr:GSU2403 family nucleotidyltransferase fold protein [Sphingomonas sp. CL5.1]QKS00449.1 hypothetical protein F9288_13075 [Sphingomonas sp. CL5.1]
MQARYRSTNPHVSRALRVPMISSDAGPILREADRRGLLDQSLIVVGTNAIAAYALEAAGFIPEIPQETEDFDLAWAQPESRDGEQTLWEMLKAVDPTFTINTERTFQARNARAYEVEILVAPSRTGTMDRTDRPRPVPSPHIMFAGTNSGTETRRFAGSHSRAHLSSCAVARSTGLTATQHPRKGGQRAGSTT